MKSYQLHTLLRVLEKGSDAWNEWRKNNSGLICLSGVDLSGFNLANANLDNVDFTDADLSETNFFKASLRDANFSKATLCRSILSKANLTFAQLTEADLTEADLTKANLFGATLIGSHLVHSTLIKANLTKAQLFRAYMMGANLSGAILKEANLLGAVLEGANLSGADLTAANLIYSFFISTNIDQATLTSCKIFGISVWGVEGVPKEQSKLIITPDDEVAITVDNLQIAQFIYLLINNKNVREVIDTITSKVVLILGRFTKSHKMVLDAIRDELKLMNFTPIIFDFDKPVSKTLTGTVETLARMARFIIADLSDSKSVAHELASIVPFLSTTPILPIKLINTEDYSMFHDLRNYPWVLPTHTYENNSSLINSLSQIIAIANDRAATYRN